MRTCHTVPCEPSLLDTVFRVSGRGRRSAARSSELVFLSMLQSLRRPRAARSDSTGRSRLVISLASESGSTSACSRRPVHPRNILCSHSTISAPRGAAILRRLIADSRRAEDLTNDEHGRSKAMPGCLQAFAHVARSGTALGAPACTTAGPKPSLARICRKLAGCMRTNPLACGLLKGAS